MDFVFVYCILVNVIVMLFTVVIYLFHVTSLFICCNYLCVFVVKLGT